MVTAVADTLGTDPLDLDPLYHVIDPDALNRLFQRSTGIPQPNGRVIFTMADCTVVVHSTGEIDVTPPGEGSPETDVADASGETSEAETTTD